MLKTPTLKRDLMPKFEVICSEDQDTYLNFTEEDSSDNFITIRE